MSSAASDGRGIESRRPRLPAEISGFVGRASELTGLVTLLRDARLVTVTGPGGIGKTRLALRAAALSGASGGSRAFPAGGCLIDLSEITDPELLPAAIASGLGLRDADHRSPLTQVMTSLRGSRMLLILDTCEHLIGACARFVARLLRETEGVTILTTSRQPLHLPGERVLRLGPLPVPGLPSAGFRGAPLTGTGDAVELFAGRAACALPGFTVTAAELPDVIRLCQRLDGIPLAIELAALRVRALPLTVLIQRLDGKFATLTATRRGTVARHRTLRAAIAWSYELCTPAERAVWDRLSAISGSFDLAAAVAVAPRAEVPADQVLRALDGLADKSVIQPAGGSRYRLLSPMREYAAERLTRASQNAERRQWQLAPSQGRQLQHDREAPGSNGAADTMSAGHMAIISVSAETCTMEASGGGNAITEKGSTGDSLTSREWEIAALVASGLSNREIASRLVISRRTVDAHINHIFGKLSISSRVQLTLWMHERGRVPRPRGGELSPAAHA